MDECKPLPESTGMLLRTSTALPARFMLWHAQCALYADIGFCRSNVSMNALSSRATAQGHDRQ